MKRLFKVLVLISLASCGFSSPNGYVIGTSGYLKEYNTGKFERLNKIDRAQLNNLIRRIDDQKINQ
jgi:hypothetical protein